MVWDMRFLVIPLRAGERTIDLSPLWKRHAEAWSAKRARCNSRRTGRRQLRGRGERNDETTKGRTRSNGERFDAQVVKVVPSRGRIKEGLGSREYHGRAVVHM